MKMNTFIEHLQEFSLQDNTSDSKRNEINENQHIINDIITEREIDEVLNNDITLLKEKEQQLKENPNQTHPNAKYDRPIPPLPLNKKYNSIKEFLESVDEISRNLLQKIDLSNTKLNEQDKIRLLIEIYYNQDCYSHHKYHVGKINQQFHIKLNKDAQLRKQRPSKVPLQYREKLKELLKTLEENGIIAEMGKDNNKHELGTSFINPIIIIPKGNNIKIVLDARFINSVSDLTTYSWPLEPLETILTRLKGKIFSTADMSCAYMQVPLTKATQRLVSFVVGGTQYTFMTGFYGLSGLPNFFSRVMTIAFKPIVESGDALTYLDDILLMAEGKEDMFKLIKIYHKLLKASGMKAAPDKSLFFLDQVRYLGHIVSGKGISPVESKVKALKELKAPTTKKEMLRVIGAFGFYSKYIKNLHVDCKPFFTLIRNDTKFEWTTEHQKLFDDIKNRITADTTLAIPNINYPFYIHVDSSVIGTGSILVQSLPEGKRIISFNSRIFTDTEQKLSTQIRELTGLIHALETYKHLIIGSKHPIYIFCDHKPILYLWAKMGLVSPRFYRYQQVILQFTNLVVVWTPGSNLQFPDLLSRNFSLEEKRINQLKHKVLPKELRFLDGNGREMHYYIEHSDETIKGTEKPCPHDTYPIICEMNGKKVKMQIHGKENTVTSQLIETVDVPSLQSIHNIKDMFRYNIKLNEFTSNDNNENVEPQKMDTNAKQISSHNICEINVPEYMQINETAKCNEHDCLMHTLQKTEDQTGTLPISDENYIVIPPIIGEIEQAKMLTEISLIENKCKLKYPANLMAEDDFYYQKNPDIYIEETQSSLDKLKSKFDSGQVIDITDQLLLTEQEKDKVLSQVRQWVKNKELPNNISLLPNTALKSYAKRFDELQIHETSQLLCKFDYNESDNSFETGSYKVCIPLSLMIPIFYKAHTGQLQGHHGIQKTIMAIRTYYFFPGITPWIHALIQDCKTCQKNKPIRHDLQTAKLLSPIRQVTEPLHTIHIDYKGPINPKSQGYEYVLMIIDAYSKYVFPIPTANATGETTINGMRKFTCIFGIPKCLIFDRGTHFINRKFLNWATNLGIECKPLSGYNPWSNGIVEVQNKFLGTYLRMFTKEFPNNWAELTHDWAYAQNTSYITHLGLTPHEIMFGTKPNVPLILKMGIFRDKDRMCMKQLDGICYGLPNHTHHDDTHENTFIKDFLNKEISKDLLKRENTFTKIYHMIYKRNRMDDIENAHKNRNISKLGKPLNIGQYVLVENKDIIKDISQKLLPKRKGIYEVIKVISPVTYKLKLTEPPHTEIYRHRNMLLPYKAKEETLPALIDRYEGDDDENDDDYYYYDNLPDPNTNTNPTQTAETPDTTLNTSNNNQHPPDSPYQPDITYPVNNTIPLISPPRPNERRPVTRSQTQTQQTQQTQFTLPSTSTTSMIPNVPNSTRNLSPNLSQPSNKTISPIGNPQELYLHPKETPNQTDSAYYTDLTNATKSSLPTPIQGTNVSPDLLPKTPLPRRMPLRTSTPFHLPFDQQSPVPNQSTIMNSRNDTTTSPQTPFVPENNDQSLPRQTRPIIQVQDFLQIPHHLMPSNIPPWFQSHIDQSNGHYHNQNSQESNLPTFQNYNQSPRQISNANHQSQNTNQPPDSLNGEVPHESRARQTLRKLYPKRNRKELNRYGYNN